MNSEHDVPDGGAAPDAELDHVLERVAAEPPPAPASLAAGIMERVDALSRHGWHAVVDEDRGVTRITAGVVAVVARRAASSVPGVVSTVVRVLPADPAEADLPELHPVPPATQPAVADGVAVAGRDVAVVLRITAGPDAEPLVPLAARVRATVTAQVRALTGLDAVRVDVHIADLATG